MSNRPPSRRLRIFISSPSDVSEERRLARELVDGVLRKDPAFRDHLLIESVAWDDPEAPTPMLATEEPQISVNAAKPRPSQCDIVVVTLWSLRRSPGLEMPTRSRVCAALLRTRLPGILDRYQPPQRFAPRPALASAPSPATSSTAHLRPDLTSEEGHRDRHEPPEAGEIF
jgi:hypothetical protein